MPDLLLRLDVRNAFDVHYSKPLTAAPGADESSSIVTSAIADLHNLEPVNVNDYYTAGDAAQAAFEAIKTGLDAR